MLLLLGGAGSEEVGVLPGCSACVGAGQDLDCGHTGTHTHTVRLTSTVLSCLVCRYFLLVATYFLYGDNLYFYLPHYYSSVSVSECVCVSGWPCVRVCWEWVCGCSEHVCSCLWVGVCVCQMCGWMGGCVL